MVEEKLEYKAMIWDEAKNINGMRVNVYAKDLDEANFLLEKEYGKGNVFNLRNEEEANKPR